MGDGTLNKVRKYYGGFEYEKAQTGSLAMTQFPMSEGRVTCSGSTYAYEYQMKDHLGNVRASFTCDAGTPIMQQEDYYYPFGLSFRMQDAASANRYLYNGKEKEDFHNLGWNDYGARFYDPQLGRWHVMDPKRDNSSNSSPYIYCLGNPINFTDPDGNHPWIANLARSNPIELYMLRNTSDKRPLNYMRYSSAECESYNHGVLEKAVNIICDKSPQLGVFLKNNQIPILIASNLIEAESASGVALMGKIGAIIDKSRLNNPIFMAAALLHESVHMNGGSEFSAWSATVSAGLVTDQGYLNTLKWAWDKTKPGGVNYWAKVTSGMDSNVETKAYDYVTSPYPTVVEQAGKELLQAVHTEGDKINAK